MGNKSQYTGQIMDAIEELAPNCRTGVDLFSGTGVISRALAQRRPTVSIDIQAYTAVLTQAMCNPQAYTAEKRLKVIKAASERLGLLATGFRELIEYESAVSSRAQHDPLPFALMVEEGSLVQIFSESRELAAAKVEVRSRGLMATIANHYGGVYYSYRQALQLDALLWVASSEQDEQARHTLLAAALGAASAAVGTVGSHFAQPARLRDRSGMPKIVAIRSALRSRSIDVFQVFDSLLQKYAELEPSKFTCRSRTGDYRSELDMIHDEIGVIYADPPYTRDHYSRFYHVLETIARGDEPGFTTAPGVDRPSRGIYRKDRHQSPFSIRSQVLDAMSDLFSRARAKDSPVVLSYSPRGSGTAARAATRLLSIDEISACAESYYGSVQVRPISDSTHSQFNRRDLSGEAASDAEVLILMRP